MAMKMGDYLVSVGVLSENQVNAIVKKQSSGDGRKFGEIAVSEGFMEESAIRRFNDYLASS